MKYTIVLVWLLIAASGCNRNGGMTNLLNEQKLLKDSANNLNARIGDYLGKGVNDSAEIQKKQLGAVYARLISIQSSLDSLEKIKK